MKKFYFFGFLILVLIDTFRQLTLKQAGLTSEPSTLDADWIVRMLSEKWIYLSILGSLGAFLTWMTLLRHAPLGPAYIASHLEIVSVIIFSYFLFGETLTPIQILGALLILLGIGLLGWSESREQV